MPSLSLDIPNSQSELAIEYEPRSPSSSVFPCSPISISRHSDDTEEDSDVDSDTSPNLKFSFEDWHTPFNTPCQVEFEAEGDGTQVLLIPHTSPFFPAPPKPKFDTAFAAGCSLPSVCPTLSGKFDLLHSQSPLSCASFVNRDTQYSPGSVVIVDSEPMLDDGFPGSIRVVRDVVDKTIPDFPEDAHVVV